MLCGLDDMEFGFTISMLGVCRGWSKAFDRHPNLLIDFILIVDSQHESKPPHHFHEDTVCGDENVGCCGEMVAKGRL